MLQENESFSYINSLVLSNFVDRKTPYFIHWDLSEKGYPIYDFLYFFKNHYSNLEMNSLFQIYQSKFQFTQDENVFVFCLLLLIVKYLFLLIIIRILF